MIHLYPRKDREEIISRIQITENKVIGMWDPQPRQADMFRTVGLFGALRGDPVQPAACQMIGYGGAAFGGKTEAAVAIALVACVEIPGIRIGYFRRRFTELEGADGPVDRSRGLYPNYGGKYNSQKHIWTFPNGAEVHFCHCNNPGDRFNYQSQAFDILIIDEATHFTWQIVDYLITRNRPSKSMSITDPSIFRPFSLLLTNPGNIGHAWYLKLFDPMGEKGPTDHLKEVINMNGQPDISYFIPAFLADNPRGLEKDPEYETNLRRREPALADQLLHGDWSHFAGQILKDFNYNLHSIDDFPIPYEWSRWRGMDWGYAAPWCVLNWAKNPTTQEMYIYNMVHRRYVNDPQQAQIINTDLTLPDEHFLYNFADPSMWTKRTTDDIAISTADVYQSNGVYLTPADNNQRNKIARAVSSLSQMPNGLYPVKIFRGACKVAIELLPTIVYDENNVDKIADGQEDHVWDAYCYSLTNWTPPKYENPNKKKKTLVGRLSKVEGI